MPRNQSENYVVARSRQLLSLDGLPRTLALIRHGNHYMLTLQYWAGNRGWGYLFRDAGSSRTGAHRQFNDLMPLAFRDFSGRPGWDLLIGDYKQPRAAFHGTKSK